MIKTCETFNLCTRKTSLWEGNDLPIPVFASSALLMENRYVYILGGVIEVFMFQNHFVLLRMDLQN